jgi:magnesium chelatase family protein
VLSTLAVLVMVLPTNQISPLSVGGDMLPGMTVLWLRKQENYPNRNLHGCPCGYNGDPVKECTCSSTMIARYQKRLSGPLIDRIDIHVEVPRVEYEKLSDKRLGESSAAIRSRVEAARKRQRARFKDVEGVSCNGEMRPAEIRDFCELDSAGQSLIKAAMRQLHLSARAYHRILKLSRTIADLAGSDKIEAAHLAEAVQYRPRQAL